MPETAPAGLRVDAPETPSLDRVLTPDALEFVASLHRRFDERRRRLLSRREERQARLDAGERPDFLAETSDVRDADWQVADTPADLERRTVEITGPVDRKMMINALNSGADTFMADFEDSLSPTWHNVVEGQANLRDAVRRELEFTSPEGKEYSLEPETATLLVRPRGWHLDERHVEVEGEPVSASLFDFGLHFFHNARELLDRGSGPYYYLPKLESHLEARLWNDVFVFAQDALEVPRGSVRATVLVEHVLAAFEMEEILWELREHSAGLNAGRWDYIFSIIKTFGEDEELVLPDRSQVTMTVPFMRAYTELLVRTCHRRGAHAIGGMAAFIPSRDPEVNERAFAEVREDKVRESRDGFDGTWVAHPHLVDVAREAFREVKGDAPHQKGRLREDVSVEAGDLLDVRVPGGEVTEDGVRSNTSVALQYLSSWLGGTGAAAIFNLMEDTATCEISRAQLWQWVRNRVELDDGRPATPELYRQIREEELDALLDEGDGGDGSDDRLRQAARLLDDLVLAGEFAPFMTLSAYPLLD
ncbi:MAG: malate synthase A [Gemmatimonadota bacterium]